jgi:hypothetical protein
MAILTTLLCAYAILPMAPLVVIPGARYVSRLFWRDHVSTKIHSFGESLINEIDTSIETLEEIVPKTHKKRLIKVRKLAAAVASECRTHYGFRSRTEANELVARKFIRDRLNSVEDLRKADIPLIMPFAINLCFIPSQSEIVAEEMMASNVVQQRLRAGRAQHWDWRWTWFGHFDSTPTSLSG